MGADPGTLFLGNFTGNPDSLDLVVLNAGSNDLTLIRGINLGDDAEQTISSGGLFPSSAVMGDFDGTLGLLVANNGDGRLALFLAGSEGLTSAGVFSQADLPNPTSLAMDSLGTIYGTTEGLESAIRVLIDVTPDSSAGGLAGLLETAQRPEDQLLTLIVALTASADPAEAEGPVPVQDSTTATEATGVGFANQPLPHSEIRTSFPLSSWDGPEPTLALRAVTEAGWDPVAWVVAGLDEAFQHASVTTLAAPAAAASAATDPETPDPAADPAVIEARTGSPMDAAGPSLPAQMMDSIESAPAEPPVQPLALSESSLFSPLAPAGSGEALEPGKGLRPGHGRRRELELVAQRAGAIDRSDELPGQAPELTVADAFDRVAPKQDDLMRRINHIAPGPSHSRPGASWVISQAFATRQSPSTVPTDTSRVLATSATVKPAKNRNVTTRYCRSSIAFSRSSASSSARQSMPLFSKYFRVSSSGTRPRFPSRFAALRYRT